MPKSSSSEASDGEPAPKRQRLVEFEPIRLPSIGSAKEIDQRILKAQHYKVCERLRQKERQRKELEKKIEDLEARRQADDELVCVVNSCWNKFDEQVGTFLLRLDHESTASDVHSKIFEKFLTVLNQSTPEDVNDQLLKRVDTSTRSLSKLVSAISSLSAKRDTILMLLKNNPTNSPSTSSSSPSSNDSDEKKDLPAALKEEVASLSAENSRLEKLVTELQTDKTLLKKKISKHEDAMEIMENKIENTQNEMENLKFSLQKSIDREEKLDYRLAETVRIAQTAQKIVVEQKEESAIAPEELSGITNDKLKELQSEMDQQTELAANRLTEIQDFSSRNQTLVSEIEDLKKKLSFLPTTTVQASPDYMMLQSKHSALIEECKQLNESNENLKKHIVELKIKHAENLEELRSANQRSVQRMHESASAMNEELHSVKKDCEMLNLEFQTKVAAQEQKMTTYREAMKLVDNLNVLNTQLKNEIKMYKKSMKDAQADAAKAYNDLKHQEKLLENSYIIRLEEYTDMTPEEKALLPAPAVWGTIRPPNDVRPDQLKPGTSPKPRNGIQKSSPYHDHNPGTPNASRSNDRRHGSVPKSRPEESRIRRDDQLINRGDDKPSSRHSSPSRESRRDDGDRDRREKDKDKVINGDKERREERPKEEKNNNGDVEREERNQEKAGLLERLREKELQVQNLQQELGLTKKKIELMSDLSQLDQDRVNLTAKADMALNRCNTLVDHVKKFHHMDKKERSKYFNDDFRRRIRTNDKTVEKYRKELCSSKAECEGLMAEMEAMAHAFDELTDQNKKLLGQLDEKDETVIQLTGERIRCAATESKLGQQIKTYEDVLQSVKVELEAKNILIKQLEDFKKLQEERQTLSDQDLKVKNNAFESQKRKTQDSMQYCQDLKVQLEKSHEEVSHLSKRLSEKAGYIEGTSSKITRLKEDRNSLKRKLDQYKKAKKMENMDEVLMEENKMLREQINCPSCKTNEKNAVLTKCYHVFCHDCIRTRYEQRRRKCPKCNANFGANDFHRLYIN